MKLRLSANVGPVTVTVETEMPPKLENIGRNRLHAQAIAEFNEALRAVREADIDLCKSTGGSAGPYSSG